MPYGVIVALLLLVCAGCKEAQPRVADTLPPYLLSHTAGTISRNANVQFTLDTVYPEGNITFALEPNVVGTTSLVGEYFIFRPDAPLSSGQSYQATVQLADRPPYSFTFSTPRRELELQSTGYYIPDPSQPARVELTGRLVTNDGASPEEMQQVLTASYRDRPLEVSVVQQSSNVFTYSAAIPNRGTEPGTAILQYDGQGAFAGAQGKVEVHIYPVGTFELLGVATATDGEGIVARFSDPLDPTQDLAGLLRFRPEVDFTTAVDGNLLTLYPAAGEVAEATLLVDAQLQSVAGKPLGRPTQWQVQLGRSDPALRAVSNGTIMPHDGQRLYTFEAIGLDKVYFELFRIRAGSVLQFLQEQQLGDTGAEWSLRRVGTIVARQEIPLATLAPGGSSGQWTRYAIDLGDYITAADDASLYQVRLAFGLEHTTQACGAALADYGLQPIATQLAARSDFQLGFTTTASLLTDYNGIYNYYDWEQRDDPCSPAYYNRDHFLLQNVLSSNLGLIAKRNPDRSTLIFTTNLLKAAAQAGVGVTAYSYAGEQLATGSTDAEGRLLITTEQEPAFLVAQLKEETAYLRLQEEDALPLGRFAVEGSQAPGGLRGAFFAERGVWRPGDSVFLHFVLEDREGVLPADYPITFTLTDPRGRMVEQRSVRAAAKYGLYPLTFRTDADDPTGSWSAEVRAAGQTYRRTLPIEAVKPNRLAIDLENGARAGDPLRLTASWLYGAPAAGLRADIMVRTQARAVDYPGLVNFVYQDPARPIEDTGEQQLFEGRLDQQGNATVPTPTLGDQLPGPLQLRLSTKVYEPGGNFSVDNVTLPYDPYTIYAGVALPQDEWGNKAIATAGSSAVELAAVQADGKGAANRRLSVGIYRVDWRYWWQDGGDNVARFSSSAHTESIATYAATTGTDGRVSLSLSVPDWGRYLIRVCDAGGHCAGDYFYGGSSSSGQDDRQAASLLRLRADRETVAPGEQVSLNVPTSAGGNLLVSLETAAGSIEQFWVPTTAGQTQVAFRATAQMVPTVYANVSYLQPYAQTTNDRPVRLFGVVPVEVQTTESLLQPIISTASTWTPQETVDVTITEADDREMAYVLAVVDEGLLGLTRFTTPDLHGEFFSKEALSVKTYDLYDQVMSSINGEFGKVLALGGDGEIITPEEASANRFPPVVRHLGPFTLKGGSRTHTLTLPNYLGAVRVMVVAVGERAYGSAEQRVTVTQPLMVLPTLPRVLGPEETVYLPVNVITTDDARRRLAVRVKELSGLVDVTRPDTTLTFTGSGDQLAYFPVTVGDRTGVARFAVTASAGGDNSSQEVEVAVRQPNLPTTRSTTVSLAPGESRQISYTPFGLAGSRQATAELSGLPAMNLQRHLTYLLQYPYGCVEQTISAAFAQLYVDKVMILSPEQTARRRDGVSAGIEALRRFQTGSGGLGYWPGDEQVHPWATSYGLHFLLEAERAGFGIPYALKQQLLAFQQSAAGSWTSADGAFYISLEQRSLDQAYRLYTLALANEASIGAMNRLRGLRSQLAPAAAYQLAAAYALAGRSSIAAELIQNQPESIKPYRELGYTFGSDIRDMAIILQAHLAMQDQSAAAAQALRLAEAVGGRSWLSTQEAAFAFVALGQLGDQSDRQIKAEFTSPTGAATTVGTGAGVYDIELPTTGEQRYGVKNTGSATLYVATSTTGVPRAGEEAASNSELQLTVTYRDLNGQPLDVSTLASGTDFTASYTVTNPGTTGQDYQQLALRTLLPSGWEVANNRLTGGGQGENDPYDYQDYRDDRVHTFFDLPARSSKTFTFQFTATYPGRYYLPTQVGEAMYDRDIRAATKGQWVTVRRGT